jgi:hypothetical protein
MEFKRMMLTIAFGAILSIQLVSVYSDTVEKCLNGAYHKQTPSAEGPSYAECFPWKDKSCCAADTTIELKENDVLNLYHFDWDYCGNMSEVAQLLFYRSAGFSELCQEFIFMQTKY